MMENKIRTALSLGVLAGFAATGTAEAQSHEGLLRKLVSKGVLTEAEAATLREENAADAKDALPNWVETLNLKGDLRLRFDHTHDSTSDGDAANDRMRYRFRYGGTANMKNGFKAGFRIGTGSESDPISTNNTFGGGHARDDLMIDQAWVSWTGESGLALYGGKNPNFEKTGWMVSKALFDGDITPEGFEAHYELDGGLGLHAGLYFLDGEHKAGNGMEALTMAQVTYGTSLSDTTSLDLGLGLYSLDDDALTGTTKGSGNTGGQGMTPLFLDVALGYSGASQPIKLYGTLVENQEADTAEAGYIAGIKYGKAKAPGTWEAKIEYRSLEANAAWDEMTDSDFGSIGAKAANEYKNGTNTKGTIVQAKYQIYSNVQFAATWFHTKSENGSFDDENNNRLQLDLIFKF